MQTLLRRREEDAPPPFELPRAGHQWLPVSAHVVERYLVTFRVPAAKLVALVPAPLTLDVHRGHGFVSVCALDLAGMGIAGTPSWLRFDNRELLYRIGVRFRSEPTFLTLRSDVTRLGRGPHWGLRTERAEDWLTFLELRYDLTPTPAGTRVTRHTTWRRHLAPGFYFGWLQQQIIGRGQLRLLELIRERVPSEAPQYLAGEGQRAER